MGQFSDHINVKLEMCKRVTKLGILKAGHILSVPVLQKSALRVLLPVLMDNLLQENTASKHSNVHWRKK